MKMSDVFNLPLTTHDYDYALTDSQGNTPINDCNGNEEEVAHAINNHDRMADEVAELREVVKRLVGNGIDLLNVDDVEDEEDAASIHAKFNDVINEAGALIAKHK